MQALPRRSGPRANSFSATGHCSRRHSRSPAADCCPGRIAGAPMPIRACAMSSLLPGHTWTGSSRLARTERAYVAARLCWHFW